MSKVDEIRAKSKIEEVELNKLQVDDSYQRDVSENLVDFFAENWDTVASELLLISDRGPRPKDGNITGGLFLVNGQHRTKAAMKRGLTTLSARVIDLRKEADPAAIEADFRLKTNKRLPDGALERFRAQVRAGDPESLAIVRLLARFGTEINKTPNPEVGVNCVSTVESLYRLDDGAILTETLEVIRDTWRSVDGKRSKAALLKGLAWFIEKHAEKSDRTRLVNKLQTMGSAVIEARARTIQATLGGSAWVNFYKAIVDIYNEQLRDSQKLQWQTRGSNRMEDKRGATSITR